MITKITLENFFSFGQSTTIDLNRGLNIIVGINGSGKSNFLKAILLLFESIAGDGFENLFLGTWGGHQSVAFSEPESRGLIRLKFEFDKDELSKEMGQAGYRFHTNPVYEIDVFRSGANGYYLAEKLYSPNSQNSDNFIFLEMRNGEGIISTRDSDGNVGLQRYPQDNDSLPLKSTEPVLRQISDPNRFYPLYTLRRVIEEFSVYFDFDTSATSLVRQPASYDSETKLKQSGGNVATLLSKIRNNHSFSYDQIEDALRKVNPHFKDVSLDLIGAKYLLALREHHLARSISIENISDGSLAYLLLCTILYNPQRGSFVSIEEPETNLHPDMLNSIAEAIKHAAKQTQIIVTTHSALLLNAFDVDDILVFEKNSRNESIAKSSEELQGWVEDYTLGQAWLLGLIGGKRW